MNELVRITLLGGLEVQQGDRLITRFKSQKIGALLAYLAYHLHQMHSREVLIDLFWPESMLEAGRNSLSVALSTLRHQLEPPGTPANAILRADRFSIGLNPAAVITDVVQFEAAIKAAAGVGSGTEQIQRLAEAVDLYQGRLLPGFFDEWISPVQEQIATLFFDTVTHRASRILTTGHGGQILCSEATAGLLRRDLATDRRLTDLGSYRLRDLPAQERLFQIDCPGRVPTEFPAPNAEAGYTSTLPLSF
jgi:DNA-binding SARP family transcriptional activator